MQHVQRRTSTFRWEDVTLRFCWWLECHSAIISVYILYEANCGRGFTIRHASVIGLTGTGHWYRVTQTSAVVAVRWCVVSAVNSAAVQSKSSLIGRWYVLMMIVWLLLKLIVIRATYHTVADVLSIIHVSHRRLTATLHWLHCR